MDSISFLGTHRIGQITGSTNSTWQLTVDPMQNPLLTDTGQWWNVQGTDEGANAEHSDGKLYSSSATSTPFHPSRPASRRNHRSTPILWRGWTKLSLCCAPAGTWPKD